jgi:hypothetical protein
VWQGAEGYTNDTCGWRVIEQLGPNAGRGKITKGSCSGQLPLPL